MSEENLNDAPAMMRILGNIEGTVNALVEDVKEIKADQKKTNEVLTTLRVKTAGVAAAISLGVGLAIALFKSYFTHGGQ